MRNTALLLLLLSPALPACGGESNPIPKGSTGVKDVGTSSDVEAPAPDVTAPPPPEDTAVEDTTVEDTATPPQDTAVEDTAKPPEDVAPPPEDIAPPPEDTNPPSWEAEAEKINQGFIGGACKSVNDCDYADAECLTAADGFPKGMCSQGCDLYCPDQAGAIATFCINGDDAGYAELDGLCTTRCHYGLTPTGCRPGYQCVPLPRHTEPGTIVYACIPGSDQAYEVTACDKALLEAGVGFTPVPNPMDSPDGFPDLLCDVKNPLKIDPVIHGVSFRPDSLDAAPKPLFVTCPLGLSLEQTAAKVAAQGVTDIIHLGTYNCRVIAGTATLSEHGLANAIDVAGMKKSDASDAYIVEFDWEKDTEVPVTEAGSFLQWFVDTLFADELFNIILTPDYNAAHYNHFHMDLTPDSYFMK